MSLKLKTTHISMIFTVALWAVLTNAWGYSDLLPDHILGEWGYYIYDYASRILWCLPFIYLIRYYTRSLPVGFGELFTCRNLHWKSILLVFMIITVYMGTGMFALHSGFWINPEVRLIQELPKYIIVGFVEEIVYRGWGLNAFSAFMHEEKANLVSTIYFVLIHFPAYFIRWYLQGSFDFFALLGQAVFALVMGLLFGYVYRKNKSIIPPMLLHFWTDIISVLFV